MNITEQIISYQEVESGIEIKGDDYGLANHLLRKGMKQALLSNPALDDKSQSYMFATRVDGVVVGRLAMFPLQLKLNQDIHIAQSASSLEVEEKFRPMAIGTDIILYPYLNSARQIFLYAGISKMALPIYRKMKFIDLSSPILSFPKRAQFLLGKMGLPFFLQRLLSPLGDLLLKTYTSVRRLLVKKPAGYSVKKCDDVYEWIEKIVMDDEHPYKENHNKNWFKWVLNNFFDDDSRNQHQLYAIYKDNKEVGFFLTKEVYYKRNNLASGGVVFGSVIEWGCEKGTGLSEVEIYQLALPCFSKNTDLIEITSTDEFTLKKMKKLGFINHGDNHIVVKSKIKGYKDIGDISNWRIRLGYADVSFY